MQISALAPAGSGAPSGLAQPNGLHSAPVGARAARYAVLDLETTGLDARTDRVLEIAIVELDARGSEVGHFSTLVGHAGDEGLDELGAQRVHGITPAMIAGAPHFGALADEVYGRLAGKVVVGHVLDFDLGFLDAECARAGLALPDLSTLGICTRALAVARVPEAPHSLAACCSQAGIGFDPAHRALGDARATGRLLRHFIERGGLADDDLAERAARLEWGVPGVVDRTGA